MLFEMRGVFSVGSRRFFWRCTLTAMQINIIFLLPLYQVGGWVRACVGAGGR